MRRFNFLAPALDRRADVAAALGAEQIGARVYELEDGQTSNPYHFHHGIEEWLLVLAGSPVVRTPAGERVLRPGDVLAFPVGPEGGHDVAGPGTILIISDRCAVDAVEFPERGEIAINPPGKIFRTADALEGQEDR